MEVRLRITHGRTNVKEIVLGRETLIGRSADCNLKIASTEVSRRHCRIRVTDISVNVADLGSANGTLVNGKLILAKHDVLVNPGTELSIGPLKFVMEFCPSHKFKGPEDTVHSIPDTVTGLPAAKVATVPDETVDYLPSKQRVENARQAARVGTCSDEMPQFVTPETPIAGTADTPEKAQLPVVRFEESGEVDSEADTADELAAGDGIVEEPPGPLQLPHLSPSATSFHKVAAPPTDPNAPRGLFGFLRRSSKKSAPLVATSVPVRGKGQVALDMTEPLAPEPDLPSEDAAPVDDTVMLPMDESDLAKS